MPKRSVMTVWLLLFIILAGAGCVRAKDPGSASRLPPVQEKKTIQVKVYYADPNNEKLHERTATVTYGTEDEKYLASLEALRKNPEPGLVSLFQGFSFKKAKLENGKLTLDLSLAQDGRLGAGGEELAVRALEHTLFQFSEVQSIDILLDGKQAESLMGHVALPHPMVRSK